MKCNPRIEAHPILRIPIETRFDPIQLPANRHRARDPIIEPSTYGIGKGSIGVRNPVAAADVPRAHQELREWPEALHLRRNPRAKQNVVRRHVGPNP